MSSRACVPAPAGISHKSITTPRRREGYRASFQTNSALPSFGCLFQCQKNEMHFPFQKSRNAKVLTRLAVTGFQVERHNQSVG